MQIQGLIHQSPPELNACNYRNRAHADRVSRTPRWIRTGRPEAEGWLFKRDFLERRESKD